jgi:serine/threonine-protein kinase
VTWFNGWLLEDEAGRHRLRAQLASEHPPLLAEFDALAGASGDLAGFLETPALVIAAQRVAQEDLLISPGSMIGPYRVVTLLARGGMGDVYRATDLRLQRDVAVKVLTETSAEDPYRLERFMNEARLTASLDHPNVVRVYDVGRFREQTYLVAELLDGETLRARISRGPMSAADALELAMQIVSGLAAAHDAGLVHRDLKPENIFITRSGVVKILDFGIAKLSQDDGAADGFSTLTGVVLGTAGYLAPEQIRGERVGPAADLFAVGVVLFEALTGVRAFVREHLVETLYAILHEPPSNALAERRDVPADFISVIMRLLEKSPASRFQSCGELMDALRRIDVSTAGLSTPPRTPGVLARPRRYAVVALLLVLVAALTLWWYVARPTDPQMTSAPAATLAILPFKAIAAGDGNDLLQAGLAEVLVSRLGRLSEVRVLPLTATERLRGREQPAEGARGLGATHLLSGTVQRDGQRVRATVQLLHTADERTIWSAPIDADSSSVFSIQDIIVTKVIEELAPRIAAGNRRQLADPGTRNNDAYEAYVLGRAYVAKGTRAELTRAAEFFSRAVALDPGFADAWASLGMAHKRMTVGGDIRPAEAFEPAKQAAGRALKIDPDHGEAHAVLGTAAFLYDWDYGRAERLLRRALELEPSSADAQLFLAHLFSNLGRHDEALKGIRRAQAFDPAWAAARSLEGQFLFMARRYEESLERLDAVVQIEPGFPSGHIMRAYSLLALGRFEEALKECQRTIELRRQIDGTERMYSWGIGLEGYALGRAGRPSDAARNLEALRTYARTQYVSPYAEALVLLGLGQQDAALERLQAAIDLRDHRVTFLAVDPKWDELRGLPAFRALLSRVNLPDLSATR